MLVKMSSEIKDRRQQAHTNENYGNQIANPAAARVGKESSKKFGARDAQEFLRQQPELILGDNWIGQTTNRLYAVERLQQFSKDRGKHQKKC